MARGAIKPIAAAREIENCMIEMVLEHVGVSDNFAGKRCQFCLKVIDQRKVDEMKGIKTRKSSCTPIKTLQYKLTQYPFCTFKILSKKLETCKSTKNIYPGVPGNSPSNQQEPLISARLSRRS